VISKSLNTSIAIDTRNAIDHFVACGYGVKWTQTHSISI
jgi:hypothetical protein